MPQATVFSHLKSSHRLGYLQVVGMTMLQQMSSVYINLQDWMSRRSFVYRLKNIHASTGLARCPEPWRAKLDRECRLASDWNSALEGTLNAVCCLDHQFPWYKPGIHGVHDENAEPLPQWHRAFTTLVCQWRGPYICRAPLPQTQSSPKYPLFHLLLH